MSEILKVIGLVAFAGGGKSTLANGLVECLPNAYIMKAITSRSWLPRDKEGDFEYLERRRVVEMVKVGEIFAARESNGNIYGVRRSTVQEAVNKDGIGIRCIMPDAIPEWYEIARGQIQFYWIDTSLSKSVQRLKARGETPEFIKNRTREEDGWRDVCLDLRRKYPLEFLPGVSIRDTLCNALVHIGATWSL